MEGIVEEVEELIIKFIINRRIANYIDTPAEILNVLNFDAVEDIKDRLWDLIKCELDYHSMFDEIEKHKESEEKEEEDCCCNDSDSE